MMLVVLLRNLPLCHRKRCCEAIKSTFINEGKHGGEVTLEAVRLIAHQVKIHDCQLHPDILDVGFIVIFQIHLFLFCSFKSVLSNLHYRFCLCILFPVNWCQWRLWCLICSYCFPGSSLCFARSFCPWDLMKILGRNLNLLKMKKSSPRKKGNGGSRSSQINWKRAIERKASMNCWLRQEKRYFVSGASLPLLILLTCAVLKCS